MTTANTAKLKSGQYRVEPSSAQMRKEALAFAQKLRSNPEQAKQFFQRAGILNRSGKLATPYK